MVKRNRSSYYWHEFHLYSARSQPSVHRFHSILESICAWNTTGSSNDKVAFGNSWPWSRSIYDESCTLARKITLATWLYTFVLIYRVIRGSSWFRLPTVLGWLFPWRICASFWLELGNFGNGRNAWQRADSLLLATKWSHYIWQLKRLNFYCRIRWRSRNHTGKIQSVLERTQVWRRNGSAYYVHVCFKRQARLGFDRNRPRYFISALGWDWKSRSGSNNLVLGTTRFMHPLTAWI